MERVYSAENPLLAQHIKNLLLNDNIECLVKNENMQSLAGEVPPISAWPEVWIINSEDKERAEAIITNSENSSDGEAWRCSRCDENNESNFQVCWKCSSSKETAC